MAMDVFAMRRVLDEGTIRRLVEAFYVRVRADELLGPVFAARVEAGAWPAHLDRMVAFWSTILLGTGSYRGDPMRAHEPLTEVEAAHFDRWLALFDEVAREIVEVDVAAAILQRARRMDVQLRARMGLPASS